jgi:hypothetical protein
MSGTISVSTLLTFAAGIFTAILGVIAKYLLDYRISRRRLELDERAALTAVMGSTAGQLRRSAQRMADRVDTVFTDTQHALAWARPADQPQDDGYFLRSMAQRLFNVVTWGTLYQYAIDTLPPETLRARKDLVAAYQRVELLRRILVEPTLFPGYPGYSDEYEGFHLFVGTVDAVADIGSGIQQANDKTLPSGAFDESYNDLDSPLQNVRWFLGSISMEKPRTPVVLARLACLGSVLAEFDQAGQPDERSTLAARLRRIEGVPQGYDLAGEVEAALSRIRRSVQGSWKLT